MREYVHKTETQVSQGLVVPLQIQISKNTNIEMYYYKYEGRVYIKQRHNRSDNWGGGPPPDPVIQPSVQYRCCVTDSRSENVYSFV